MASRTIGTRAYWLGLYSTAGYVADDRLGARCGDFSSR